MKGKLAMVTGETTQSIEVNTIALIALPLLADGCENNTCYKLKAFNGNASLYVIENSEIIQTMALFVKMIISHYMHLTGYHINGLVIHIILKIFGN